MKKLGKSILKAKIPYDVARRMTEDREYGRSQQHIIIPTSTEIIRIPKDENLNLIVIKQNSETTFGQDWKSTSIKYAKTTAYERKLFPIIEIKESSEELLNTFSNLIEQHKGEEIGQRQRSPSEKNIYYNEK